MGAKKTTKRGWKRLESAVDVNDVEQRKRILTAKNSELFFTDANGENTLKLRRSSRAVKLTTTTTSTITTSIGVQKTINVQRTPSSAQDNRQDTIIMSTNLYDLWSTSAPEDQQKQQQQVKRPLSMRPETDMEVFGAISRRGIAVCAPGSSYNPREEDRQSVLAEALKLIDKKEAKSRLWNRSVENAQRLHVAAMDETLLYEDPSACDQINGIIQDEQGDNVAIKRCAIKAENRRRKADKHRLARHKRMLVDHREMKEATEFRKQLEQIQKLAVEVKNEVVTTQEKGSIDKVNNGVIPRVGPKAFQPRLPEYILSEENHGSMRKIKASSASAAECLYNLQRQGLIEQRNRCTRSRRPVRERVFNRYNIDEIIQQ